MIEVEEFVERLCQLCARRGPRRFPKRARDREILMKSIRMTLDAEREYSEAEINSLLERWRTEIAPEINIDFATLRRLLVDAGELERTRSGSKYRVGFPTGSVAFELEVDGLDLRATIAAYRMNEDRRRQAHKELHGH